MRSQRNLDRCEPVRRATRAHRPDRKTTLERTTNMKNLIVAFALVASFAACKSEKTSVVDPSAPKAECSTGCDMEKSSCEAKSSCEEKQAAGTCPATQAKSSCCAEKPQG